MDFIDKLRELSSQIPKLEHQGLIKTEEGTKNALIMPFINALGYNVFDPTEVTPELVADVGTKKGEKVDYAILRDGKAIMLFECKSFKTNLGDVHASQLFRYFTVSEAQFGILTNGVVYQFYTDLEAANKMDTKPFLVIDMLDLKEPLIEELKKFTKGAFDVDVIHSTANQLKYMNSIRQIIMADLNQPSDEFVRYFASKVYHGALRQSVIADFTDLVKRAWKDVINDRIKETFTKAAERVEEQTQSPDDVGPAQSEPSKVVTTDDEMEAFRIIKAIVREIVDVKRVTLRDAQTYCSVLLDDNNRKPICRLYFNGSKKSVVWFDEQKLEQKIQVEHLDDLYKLGDQLKATVSRYDQSGVNN